LDLILAAGRSNLPLAEEISRRIFGATSISSKTEIFADGELIIKITGNVRNKHVIIVQSTNPPSDHWIELFLLCDAAQRAGAAKITVVMPYFGYARQDRQGSERESISAARMAKLVIASGASQIIVIELHSAQVQGVIDEPFVNLRFQPILLTATKIKDWSTRVFVSPDSGGVGRVRAIASKLGRPVAFIDKRREKANESEVMHVVGEVAGFEAVLLDDLSDTSGTLVKGAVALREKGATRVIACITHGLFSKDAATLIRDSPIEEIYVSDTIKITDEKRAIMGNKLKIVPSAPLLEEAIRRIHNGDSLKVLFDNAIRDLLDSSKF